MTDAAPERLQRQVEFLRELERLKLISRRNWVVDRSRRENSAEHSWHVALAAMVLQGHSGTPQLSIDKVVRMLLVHDIVEIDANDTWAYDETSAAEQAARESPAAERIFRLLPSDQAEEMLALWREFEDNASAEARFAKAVDALQPLLNHMLSGDPGSGEQKPTVQQVLARKAFIKAVSPALWDLAQRLIEDSTAQGLYRHE